VLGFFFGGCCDCFCSVVCFTCGLVLGWVKISFILVNETIKGDKSFIKEWFCFLIVDIF